MYDNNGSEPFLYGKIIDIFKNFVQPIYVLYRNDLSVIGRYHHHVEKSTVEFGW